MEKIIFITGAPGSGKTTISHLVAKQFTKSVHLSVDTLRSMMVNGILLPVPGVVFSEEVEEQFGWARTTAIYMARLYAEQGFVVVIDDVCVPARFAVPYQPLFSTTPVQKILLMPNAETLTKRMQERAGPFDKFLISETPWLYSYLEPISKTELPESGWIVLDNSNWSVEKTLREVIREI